MWKPSIKVILGLSLLWNIEGAIVIELEETKMKKLTQYPS